MSAPEITTLVNVIGLSTQVASAILIALLFQLLRPQAGRRRYFAVWSIAWAVFAVALVALLPAIKAGGAAAGGEVLPIGLAVGLTVYQVGKIAFLVLLLVGTLLYVRGGAWRRTLLWGLGLGVPFALASSLVQPDVTRTLLWQAAAGVPVTAACAYLFLSLPAARQTLGSRLSGVIFACKATAFAGNLLYSWHTLRSPDETLIGWASWISEYGAYLDLLLDIVLSFGMVLLLAEETVREVSSAYDELAVTHGHLERDSCIDPLTGALNRLAFERGFGMESIRASYGAVAVFDLDDLKAVNDRHGHQAGDRALQHFVESLRSLLRPSDKIFRWGGDEFLAVLPRAQAAEFQARLAERLPTIRPLRLTDGSETRVNASFGVADYRDGSDLAVAIETADSRMYVAKRERKRFTAA
jgi:diguanylate cyclase (GGDEF)-like protein